MVAHRHIEHAGASKDTFMVAQTVKSELTVIRAHSAIPYSSERHGRITDMHDRVVDATSAKRKPAQYLMLYRLIFGK